MTTQSITVIGADFGNGFCKFTNGQQTISFPSVVGLPTTIRDTSVKGLHVETPHGTRFVGDLALAQSTVKWQATNQNRTEADILALLYAGLSELEAEGDIMLMTGLPNDYFLSEKPTLIKILEGEHYIQQVGHSARRVNIYPKVMMETSGVYFRYLYNDEGKMINGRINHKVGIIAPGTGTVDHAIFQQGKALEPTIGSSDAALNKLYEMVDDELSKRFGLKLKTSIRNALDAGFVTDRNAKKHNLGPIVEPILQAISAQYLNELAQKWTDEHLQGVHAIITAGGGSDTFGAYYANRYNNIEIFPDGFWVVVKGYYLAGLFALNNQPKPAPKAKPAKVASLNGTHKAVAQ